MSEQSVFSLQNKRTKIGLNSFQLKLIALVTMVIDHIGAVLFPEILFFRIIGRISFPIYGFLVTEGFFHTSDVKRYMKRLLVFAFVSEIPFDLAVTGQILEFGHQNVFFTLFIGVLFMYTYTQQTSRWEKVICVIFLTLLGDVFSVDYGAWGVLMIFCFYVFREKNWAKYLTVGCINVLAFGYIQAYAVLAFLPIALYNGEKGKERGKGWKYFFYAFYPAHLLLLWFVKILG